LVEVDVSRSAGLNSAPSASAAPRAATRLSGWLDREGLLVLVVAGFAGIAAAVSKVLVATDTWYALVSGRLITQHGLPFHNQLTLWAHGTRWVDQQWLAQLGLYGLDRAGGIRAAIVVHVLFVAVTFAVMVVLARRSGADPRSIALVSVVALLPLALTTAQLRTQTFSYPLFAAVLVLLARPAPTTWRRLLGLLAIIVLWANLHGSVVLAAILVSLRGVTELASGLRAGKGPRQLAWLVALLPWPALLATPYLWSTGHYYRETIFNPTLSAYLWQWKPTTLSPVSLPLFVLALGFLWLVGKAAPAYTRFEKLAGLFLVALALLAVRNWTWLALFAVAFYPRGLDYLRAERRRPLETPLNRMLAALGILFAVVVSTATLGRSPSWFTNSFPDRGARVVADLARSHPNAKIWATAEWGDWLMWSDPQLQGRVAFDARVELLSKAQVKKMAVFSATDLLVPQVRKHYGIVVVSKNNDPDAYRLLRRSGSVAYDDGNVLVYSRWKGAA
jgi:hypothetical protein